MKRRSEPITSSSRSCESGEGDDDRKPRAVKPRNDGALEAQDRSKADSVTNDRESRQSSAATDPVEEANQSDAEPSSSSSSLEMSGASSEDNADEEVEYASDAERSRSPSATTGERVSTPTPFDVLFGRGFSYQMHPGNLRLHTVVKRHKDRYSNAKRLEKRAIIAEVVNLIKNGGPQNARFLERAAGSGKNDWIEQSDKRAMEKVGHALRGKPRNTRKGSPSPTAAAEPVTDSIRENRTTPLAVASNAAVTSSSGAASRQPPRDNYAYPISVAEREERRRLLDQISLLDTGTLSGIVRQHSVGIVGALASPTQQVTLASALVPGATAFPVGTQFLPIGLAGQAIASELIAPTSTFAAAVASRPDLLHQAQLSALTMGGRQAEFPDQTILASLLQQSRLQQSMLSGGQQEEDTRRLLEVLVQQSRQQGGSDPNRRG